MKRSINYTKQEKPFVRRIRCDIYGVNSVNIWFHFAQYKSKGMSQQNVWKKCFSLSEYIFTMSNPLMLSRPNLN